MEPTEAIVIQRSFAKRLFGTFYEHLGALILLNLAVTSSWELACSWAVQWQ